MDHDETAPTEDDSDDPVQALINKLDAVESVVNAMATDVEKASADIAVLKKQPVTECRSIGSGDIKREVAEPLQEVSWDAISKAFKDNARTFGQDRISIRKKMAIFCAISAVVPLILLVIWTYSMSPADRCSLIGFEARPEILENKEGTPFQACYSPIDADQANVSDEERTE